MGAGPSIPSTLTHQKLLDLTKDSRELMSFIFTYMLEQIKVNDFQRLSDENECKKYVIFIANNLHSYFHELQIVPTKDKKGVIAFRLVKDMINPPESLKQERQTLCLTLAYFYTRIFQIYGALALTLVDDALYLSQSGVFGTIGDRTTGMLPPGYRPYCAFGGEGITPDKLRNFWFLHTYLTEEMYSSDMGFRTKYRSTETEKKANIYFKPESGGSYGFFSEREPRRSQKGTFLIEVAEAKRYYISLEITVTPVFGSRDITLKFGGLILNYRDSYKSERFSITDNSILDTIIPKKTIRIHELDTGRDGEYSIDDKPINEFFTDLFNNLIPYIKKSISEDDFRTSNYKTTKEGSVEELKLSKIITNLRDVKPLGHCIARALQLLRTQPINPKEPVYSYVCKAKFLDVETRSGQKESRSGIPSPGESILTSPGISALSQLFFDTITVGSPKITMGSQSIKQYEDFMEVMRQLFQGSEPVSSSESKLSGIKNRRDKDLCSQAKASDEKIQVDYTTGTEVYKYVNLLYKQQLNHTSGCGVIFKLLFDYKKDKDTGRYRTISLSQNIIKKGFPEIERINLMARTLLIKYYTDCEKTYLQGMEKVINYKLSKEHEKTAPTARTAQATQAAQAAQAVPTTQTAPTALGRARLLPQGRQMQQPQQPQQQQQQRQ